MQKHEWYSDTGAADARERQLHPQASEHEIFLCVTAHRLDRETMLRVYGWYPDKVD
jgi:hypothetical protein